METATAPMDGGNSPRLDYAGRRRRIAQDIRRRMVDHIARGTTDLAPAPLENDPLVYTDPERAIRERRELFCRLPLVAGLSQDIPAPGDRLLFEELGQSILVVRGHDGRLRGFLNLCRHRGAKLVRADPDGGCGRGHRLTCPFHGWSYDLDGRLAAVPQRDAFGDVAPGRRGLVTVPVTEWCGLIFLRVAAGAASPDLPAFLGSFAPELAQLELADAVPVQSSRLVADTNWKLALDTYCEGYHFGTLHASTIGVTHFSNVAVFDGFEPHWRINFPGRDIAELVGRDEADWPDGDYGGVHFLFPNTVMVVGAVGPDRGFLRMFRLFPGSCPGQMTCHVAAYLLYGAVPDAAARAAFAVDDSRSDITQEDYRVAVDEYANLRNAPADFRLVYGRNEIALQAFHRSVARALGTMP